MIDFRRVVPIGCLLATAPFALAQAALEPPPPAPPAPPALERTPRAARPARPTPPPEYAQSYPAPAPAAVPSPAPMAQAPMSPLAPMAPLPPMPAYAEPLDMFDRAEIQSRVDAAMSQVRASEETARAMANVNRDFKFDFRMPMDVLAQARVLTTGGRIQNEDRLYEAGQRAMDNRNYDVALEDFNQVAARAGARADGGWYWKAYLLNKLGKRDEAIAAIAELRKSYPNSHWLDDAKALELEVKQASGRPVSPESETDEDIKLMAINSIMQSDPDRGIPLLENIIKGPQSPRVKQRALYVLAMSNSPKAQQILEQVARGGVNPDLQVRAIEYLGTSRRRYVGKDPNQGQTQNPNLNFLPEVYSGTNDPAVKRAIVLAYVSSKDSEHLLQIAKTEKSSELRQPALDYFSRNAGQPELWQLYAAESTPEGKQQILERMYSNGNVEKLTEIVRNEKEPKVRRTALQVLVSQKAANTGDTLVAIYNAEQDPQLKQSIIDTLSSQRNAKYLVDIARSEKDSKMKLRIVERLSNMKSKEASDYLSELLSK